MLYLIERERPQHRRTDQRLVHWNIQIYLIFSTVFGFYWLYIFLCWMHLNLLYKWDIKGLAMLLNIAQLKLI